MSEQKGSLIFKRGTLFVSGGKLQIKISYFKREEIITFPCLTNTHGAR